MARRVREHPWAATPLGPLSDWPPRLRMAVDTALDSAFACFVWWGPELIQIHNDACIELMLEKHPGGLGRPGREVWSEAWPVVGQMIEQVVATGVPVRHENLPVPLLRGGRMQPAHFTFCYSALRDERGDVAGVNITAIETTLQVEAEVALRESEDRFRRIFEHAATGISIADLQGRIERSNPAMADMLGYRAEELRGKPFADFIHEDDRSACLARAQALLSGISPRVVAITSRYRHRDGREIWTQKSLSLLRDDNDRATHLLALVTDITERRLREEQVQLLLREVNHRSKNMLSQVQFIARATAERGYEGFFERFEARLRALAASQDLLVAHEWEGAGVEELVRSQLGHLEELLQRQIRLDGPPLTLSVVAAQTLGMAFHELATNAAKYGALRSGGRVGIRWWLEADEAGGQELRLTWTEEGGPAVSGAPQPGYGLTVIQEIVESSLDAEVRLRWEPAGLVWELRAPAVSVMTVSEPGREPVREPEPEPEPGPSRGTPRVLLVEDDALLARAVGRILSKGGFWVVGPVKSVARALSLLDREGCDAAILDIHLGSEETSEPIAHELRARGVPFLALSGYSREQQPELFREAPFLCKPVSPDVLVEAVRQLLPVERRGLAAAEPGEPPA